MGKGNEGYLSNHAIILLHNASRTTLFPPTPNLSALCLPFLLHAEYRPRGKECTHNPSWPFLLAGADLSDLIRTLGVESQIRSCWYTWGWVRRRIRKFYQAKGLNIYFDQALSYKPLFFLSESSEDEQDLFLLTQEENKGHREKGSNLLESRSTHLHGSGPESKDDGWVHELQV